MMLHKIDDDQKLYVGASGGVSCLGFDVVRDRTILYFKRMGLAPPNPVPYGDHEAYELYESAERQYIAHPASKATTFEPHTPDPVIAILEDARCRLVRLRIFYGDRETGRDWNEENDVLGYIGRSMGPIRVPLLIKTRASTGGFAILTAHIVRIQSASDKRVLWQHATYHSLPFALGPAVSDGYVEAVYRDGRMHAQFKKPGDAARFMDRILGRRMN